MHKLYLLLALLSISVLAEAQTNDENDSTGLIPFASLENAPVFPGCVGRNSVKLKECTQREIEAFAQKNFDQSIFKRIDLNSKQIRVYVQFTIDVLGLVQDVKARAEHPVLIKEAIRVIESLPQMTPGKSSGKIVNTTYSLPLYFTLG